MKKVCAVCAFICLGFVLFADASMQMLKSWNSLSEYEKWFCLLSEPLMEQNSLSIATVNPENYIPAGKQSVSQQILENSWELYSRGDVLILLEDYRLRKLGHSVTYNKLKERLNQSAQKSVQAAVEEIAIKDCMEAYLIVRSYFVAETQDILGEYGLLAWDYGRVLSILRWSIAAGWIPESEALELAKPFIDDLINAYDSWEDYAVHYAFGRVFYAISGGNDYNAYLNDVLGYIKKYDIAVSEKDKDKIFSYRGTKFPGKNRNDNRILTYKDAVYKPSKETVSWISVVKAENNNGLTKAETSSLTSFLKKKKNIPAAASNMAVLQVSGEKVLYKTASKAFEEAALAFENVENTSDLYFSFYIRYAFIAYHLNDLKKMEYAISKFNNKTFETADLQYVYCLYYTEKAKSAGYNKKYEEAVEYAKSALFCLKQGHSLRFMGLFNRDVIKNSEENLNNMIDKYRYELRQAEQQNRSA
ncbi:MAG: DUF1266 domain-containing protein [Spirochaetaceae bacterium]|nr:DUF1266 domain-containing protein [Spirochaetaceae bacterium]